MRDHAAFQWEERRFLTLNKSIEDPIVMQDLVVERLLVSPLPLCVEVLRTLRLTD